MSGAPFPGGARCLALLFVVLTAAVPRASGAGAPSASDTSAVRLYVPNQLGASISVLDGEGHLLQNVDLHEFGYTDQAMPHQVVATPDGSRWYVTLAGAGEVVAFDAENHLVGRIALEAPGMIVLDGSRDRLYVSRALTAIRPPASLAVLRGTDR